MPMQACSKQEDWPAAAPGAGQGAPSWSFPGQARRFVRPSHRPTPIIATLPQQGWAGWGPATWRPPPPPPTPPANHNYSQPHLEHLQPHTAGPRLRHVDVQHVVEAGLLAAALVRVDLVAVAPAGHVDGTARGNCTHVDGMAGGALFTLVWQLQCHEMHVADARRPIIAWQSSHLQDDTQQKRARPQPSYERV